jgi:hypothetical protein
MGPIGCPETSVRNYHYSPRNNPEVKVHKYTIFTRMQDKVVSLNVVIKYKYEVILKSHIGAELDGTKPDFSEQDHAEPRQSLHFQIIMCREKKEYSMAIGNSHDLHFWTLSTV